MPKIDDMIKLNPDNLIYYNRTINGMPVARYIAATIISDSEYENEDYYKIEDKLTEIIQRTFINIWVEQTSEVIEPLEEKVPPKPDKPMKDYVAPKDINKLITEIKLNYYKENDKHE